MCDVLWITFFSVSFIMKFVKLFVLFLLLGILVYILSHVTEQHPLLEGFDEVPRCQTSNERVPSCYASVQSDDYLDFYSDAQREDYILKTQVVTPICPHDPYANMGIDLAQSDGMITDASGSLTFPKAASTRPGLQDASAIPQTFTGPSSFMDLSLPKKPVDPEPANSVTNEPKNESKGEPSGKSGLPVPQASEVSNSFMLNPDSSKKCEEPKPTCPPCPACERCPEPQVDCKRVIKYKDQQYPVPVIADFSQFTRYG